MKVSTQVPDTVHSLTVEQVPIDDLHPDPANPRRIGEEELEALTRSLRQWGFVQPVLARREDATVIGGHQRLVAARRLGLTEVPVIFLDITTEQARLLNLALNRISGTWDTDLLARLLTDLQMNIDLDLTLSGFGEDEISDLLKDLEARERLDQSEVFDLETAFEETTEAPRSTPGDLWALGEHRLLCGDATDPHAVARLLDGAEPRLLATDPPYGVSYDGSWRDGVYNALGPAERPYMQQDGEDGEKGATEAPVRARGLSRGHRNTTISGDTRVDWSEAFALVPSLDVGYVWHAGVHADEVAQGLKAVGFDIVSQIIWDKTLFAMGRSWYHWAHEPCWVVRRKGSKVRFMGSRDQATIWRVPSPKMIMSGSKEPKHDHPTQKPALLFEAPIRNHLKPGEAVYDPFLGSGTTLIAAERHARVCYGLEIDPRFVDVILARWERFTGQTAEHSMDDALLRLALELPLREQTRRAHRCPPSLDDPRLAEAQADLLESVIREVLASLDLPDEVHRRALAIAASALRRAAGEDRHDDPIATAHQHRLATGRDQQS